MGMMVSGMILGAVATLAWTIGTYNGQGEATADLTRQGRFGMMFLERDLRAARAAGVTDSGALVLWMGELTENGFIDAAEIILYHYVAEQRAVQRITFTGGIGMRSMDPSGLDGIMQAYDAGLLEPMAPTFGYTMAKDVVCGRVDSLAFYPKRAFPDTASVEFALELSRPENIVTGSGETVYLSFYGTGTLRAPYIENGFCSQF